MIFFTLNKAIKLCRCFLGIHNDQGIFTPRGIFCNGFKRGFAHVFIFAFLEILKIGSVGNKLIIVHIRQELIKKLRIIGHCGGEKKGFAVKIFCYIAHSFKAGANMDWKNCTLVVIISGASQFSQVLLSFSAVFFSSSVSPS